ncbi:hypothetical protein A2382_00455 [Candidatus Woesebacteria bacterium RIFOXYB1_FULL_38_16]|uniref:Uncharacterized protein n=1 Tax=Candidatus Woesebacteria bacterium RIFOXYB1_FULL_38_16 TaxID=1802538 RepID=A0A1F8CSK6_9BACT|nr:MAG: hypothetical protein A2191_01335 [Candidatus Woesebacteria bacterium RIFOXYA1_FULL_38_9]OGM79241.1 MAG: hypothetical protein A2382_00455 [Candidatus Woesebacteria bacterium RIFOXYB1_FULL_38_16]
MVEMFSLTFAQLQMVIEAMKEGVPPHTSDPVVNWAVDCLTMQEYFPYDSSLYEDEVEAFKALE